MGLVGLVAFGSGELIKSKTDLLNTQSGQTHHCQRSIKMGLVGLVAFGSGELIKSKSNLLNATWIRQN